MSSHEHSVDFSGGDPEDLEALYDELRGRPGIQVMAVPAPIDVGDQGSVLEFLTVACSGGAITVLLEIIKALAESRGSKFILKIRHGKDRLEVNTSNLDEMLPVLKELLDG